MGDRSHITIIYKRDRGRSKAPQAVAKPGLPPRKVMLCICVCMWSGIRKESFTTSCCRPVKRLILTFTVNNWKDYAKQSRERDQNFISRKGVVFHHDNARPHIFGDLSKIERT